MTDYAPKKDANATCTWPLPHVFCLLAGKSLKTLMSKGILQVHPPICDCPGCRISSPVVRHGINWSLLGRRAGFLLQN